MQPVCVAYIHSKRRACKIIQWHKNGPKMRKKRPPETRAGPCPLKALGFAALSLSKRCGDPTENGPLEIGILERRWNPSQTIQLVESSGWSNFQLKRS